VYICVVEEVERDRPREERWALLRVRQISVEPGCIRIDPTDRISKMDKGNRVKIVVDEWGGM